VHRCAGARAARFEAGLERAYDECGTTVAERWRHLADRGLTGAILAVGAAILAWHAELRLWGVWIAAALALLCGVYFVLRRNAVADAIARARTDVIPLIARALETKDEPPPPEAVPEVVVQPNTGVAKANPAMLAMLTKGKGLFGGSDARRRSAITESAVTRDARFTTFVCAGCGYTQEFADLSKL